MVKSAFVETQSGAFFLHPLNSAYINGQSKWTSQRRNYYTDGLVVFSLFLLFFVAALWETLKLISDFPARSAFDCFAIWCVALLLANHALNNFRSYKRFKILEQEGRLIYGEILRLDYESDGEYNRISAMQYMFKNPRGYQIVNTEKGQGKFPHGETTGTYVLYRNDDDYAVL